MITYFVDRGSGMLGSVVEDLMRAHREGGGQTSVTLRKLIFDYVETRLGRYSEIGLERYLKRLGRPWRVEGQWGVFKSAETPCLAFTAHYDGAATALIVLGACHSYPDQSQEKWWSGVIRPRVLAL